MELELDLAATVLLDIDVFVYCFIFLPINGVLYFTFSLYFLSIHPSIYASISGFWSWEGQR